MALTRPRYSNIVDSDYKASVRVVTTTNITLAGGAPSTYDGVSFSAGDRILVAGQNTGSQNGIYNVTTVGTGSTGTWTRSSDANTSDRLTAGMQTAVGEGTYAGQRWILTTGDPITLGSTSLTFVAGSGQPGGATKQIQYNNGGALSGATNFIYENANGNVVIAGTTTSTSTATGALVVGGGTGIAGNLWIGGNTSVGGNLTVGGNLFVQGNTITIGSNNLTVTDSIIDLHTYANLAPLISDDGRDIGIRFHYYKTSDKHAFIGWENGTQALTYYQDATETNGTVTGTLGNVEIGSLYVSNTTVSSSTTTGALQVRGGIGVGEGVTLATGKYLDLSNGAGTRLARDAAANGLALQTSSSTQAFIADTTGNLVLNSTATSISTTTGALVVSGGIGVAGNLWVGSSSVASGNINIGAGGSPSLTAWGGMAATNRLYIQGDWNQVSFGTVSANGQRFARGTPGVPTSVDDTDRLGAFFFGGYHSALTGGAGGWINPTAIYSTVEGSTATVSTALPGKLSFFTTPINGTRTERLTISSVGNVSIGTTTTTAANLTVQGATTGTAQAADGAPIALFNDGIPRSVVSIRGGVDGNAIGTSGVLNVGGGANRTYSLTTTHGALLGSTGTGGNIVVASTTASADTTSGALVVSGGVGISGAIYNSGSHVISGTNSNLLAGYTSVTSSAAGGNFAVLGNVGIGTNSIATTIKLNVKTGGQGTDGVQITDGTQYLQIRPNMGSGNNNSIVQAGDIGIVYTNGTVNTGNFVIAPWNNGNAGGLSMDQYGNVSIGTHVQTGRFAITGDAGDNATITLTNSNSNAWKIWNDIGANGLNTQYNGTTALIVGSGGNVILGGGLASGVTVNNVYDNVAFPRALVVTSADTYTTPGSSTNALTIVNSNTTTNNISQLNFAAITGASTSAFSSGWIAVQHGARTNAQYPTGRMSFAVSTSLNSAPAERLIIDNTGNLVVTSTTGTVTNSTGALVVKGGVGIAGNVYIGSNAGAQSALVVSYSPATYGTGILVQGSNTVGGTTYFDFLRATTQYASATNPNKTFRLNATGGIEIINSAYTTTIFTLADDGTLTLAGAISGSSTGHYLNTAYITNLSSGNIITSNAASTTRSNAVATTSFVRDFGGFANSQVFTTAVASASWIVPPGITKVKVTCVGGGGAGGGSAAAIGDAGAGGGSGAIAVYYYQGLTPGATVTYSVGNGGVGASGGAGGAGGASNVSAASSTTGTTITLSAPGGSGGAAGAAINTPYAGGAGGTIGTQTNGTAAAFFGAAGSAGGSSWGTAAAATCVGGMGGASYFGGAGRGAVGAATATVGAAGTGGGGGGSNSQTAAAVTGAAGGSGMVMFEF